MRNLAVITARSGSKGLPDKNIRLLNGKPLLAYTVEAAIQSEMFSCVHLSTDSEVYAEIGRKYGADVPFLRSAELASDTAGSWEVVKAVLEAYRHLGQDFDTVTLLQPTSPLRDAGEIRSAFNLMRDKNADAVVSVCEMEHSPRWCNLLPEDGSMDGFIASGANGCRQKLGTYYRLNGAIYITRCKFLLEDLNLYRAGCYAYIMDQKKSVDIDTELDFAYAELLMAHMSD